MTHPDVRTVFAVVTPAEVARTAHFGCPKEGPETEPEAEAQVCAGNWSKCPEAGIPWLIAHNLLSTWPGSRRRIISGRQETEKARFLLRAER